MWLRYLQNVISNCTLLSKICYWLRQKELNRYSYSLDDLVWYLHYCWNSLCPTVLYEKKKIEIWQCINDIFQQIAKRTLEYRQIFPCLAKRDSSVKILHFYKRQILRKSADFSLVNLVSLNNEKVVWNPALVA